VRNTLGPTASWPAIDGGLSGVWIVFDGQLYFTTSIPRTLAFSDKAGFRMGVQGCLKKARPPHLDRLARSKKKSSPWPRTNEWATVIWRLKSDLWNSADAGQGSSGLDSKGARTGDSKAPGWRTFCSEGRSRLRAGTRSITYSGAARSRQTLSHYERGSGSGR